MLGAVRTVASLGLETLSVSRYDAALHKAQRAGIKAPLPVAFEPSDAAQVGGAQFFGAGEKPVDSSTPKLILTVLTPSRVTCSRLLRESWPP